MRRSASVCSSFSGRRPLSQTRGQGRGARRSPNGAAMKRLCAVLVAGLVLLGLPTLASGQATPDRLLAVGDIHGAANAFRNVLEHAALIDADGRWAGGRARLVQTGDFTDRGRDVRAVMDLLMRLEREAPGAGGRAHVLLGNHEAMNLMAETRDVTPEIFASFAGDDAADRRDLAYRDYVGWIEARTEALGRPVANTQSRDRWIGAHPLGFLEYMEALGPDGPYGTWLRSKPIVAQIGDTIFLHGGLDPSLAARGESLELDRSPESISVPILGVWRWVRNGSATVNGPCGSRRRISRRAPGTPSMRG